MLSRIVRPTLTAARNFSTSQQNNYKVTVCGAAGGIGQPLSLLLKLNPLVTELNCYDIAPFTPGVACDLSHIETASKVKGFDFQPHKRRLAGAQINIADIDFLILNSGMTRDDLFGSNASVVKTIFECASVACPDAIFCIITNPVNSCVPIACEVLKKANKLNPRRVFGVSTLDIVRANTFVGEMCGVNPKEVNVPVIGGHSGITIVPLFSRATPKVTIPADKLDALTKRVQEAGTEVVKAKAGHGSATLSMAYSGARFANNVMRALMGEPDVIECAYVMADVTDVDYFASPVKLGKCGIEQNCGVGDINEYETKLLCDALEQLKRDIQKGVDFANQDQKCKGAPE
ncbi:unnamed protein product [Acanthoscelides obtectus]|uniref:Malate dehydrogenase, mitochondrial n=1 Tax=Acanthoscelides obtectus TaxID=200917 RepID=A0A9P0KHW2_ACAOB|nr:unnamed protein product [Acanthoscelides obtectus]CAK1664259.1 Malate dehydrogenase, mitochondrial [Acanthoscelides obtectus]